MTDGLLSYDTYHLQLFMLLQDVAAFRKFSGLNQIQFLESYFMLHVNCISKCAIPRRVVFDSEWAEYQLRRNVVLGISHTLLIYFSFF